MYVTWYTLTIFLLCLLGDHKTCTNQLAFKSCRGLQKLAVVYTVSLAYGSITCVKAWTTSHVIFHMHFCCHSEFRHHTTCTTFDCQVLLVCSLWNFHLSFCYYWTVDARSMKGWAGHPFHWALEWSNLSWIICLLCISVRFLSHKIWKMIV